MTDTAATIAKMRRYSTACDGHQVIACCDITALVAEIDRLSELNEVQKDIIQQYQMWH